MASPDVLKAEVERLVREQHDSSCMYDGLPCSDSLRCIAWDIETDAIIRRCSRFKEVVKRQ